MMGKMGGRGKGERLRWDLLKSERGEMGRERKNARL